MQDPFTDDLERLLGPDYAEWPRDEQYQRLKDAVEFHRFAPTTTPETLCAEYYNPAVDGYQDAGLSWSDDGWEPVDETGVLWQCPEYIPTDEAIETLIDLSPVLEVGAGAGYWAYVLTENGGDCVPTDKHPDTESVDSYPATVSWEGSDKEKTIWSDVRTVDGVAAIESHPDRTVLMCHPSGADRWSEDVLNAITNQTFVFVGEWCPGMDANPQFFETLATEWTCLDRFPVYDWASMHAHGYVFERE